MVLNHLKKSGLRIVHPRPNREFSIQRVGVFHQNGMKSILDSVTILHQLQFRAVPLECVKCDSKLSCMKGILL